MEATGEIMNADANELNEVGDEDEIATGATLDALDRGAGSSQVSPPKVDMPTDLEGQLTETEVVFAHGVAELVIFGMTGILQEAGVLPPVDRGGPATRPPWRSTKGPYTLTD